MLYRTCFALMLLSAAVPPAEAAPADPGPAEAGPADPLKEAYARAPLLVEFQVDTVQANPTVDPRLVWEVRAALLGVLKGQLLPGRLVIHVDSVVRVFDKPRAEVEGRKYLAPLKPLGQAAQRRFQMVGPRAWPAESKEADRLRQLADTETQPAPGGQDLRLTVKPVEPVFPVRGAKTVEVRLTNTGQDSATYVQAPIVEKGGKLYLPGNGRITIRTTTGEAVTDKGNVVTGMVPPPPPQPALILPGASYAETVDLDKYFTLPAGRYTFSMFLATPDGRGRIASNGFSFQVGVTNLPEAPKPDEPEPAEPEPEPIEPPSTEPAEAAGGDDLPEPHTYTPGEASFGLAALLRPTRTVYRLGDPVPVELRLINDGPRTVAVDTRLERTLTVTVEAVGDSPQPLMIRQVIPWPADETVPPAERAYLREAAFWGRTVNLNVLYGKKLDAIEAPTAADLADAKSLRYERFGRNLFGFPKPGTYRVTATYTVRKPKTNGGGNAGLDKVWWTGDVQSNPILIRVEDTRRR
ncbi:MAG: hypothetical protein R6X20_13080 [Phycisphaerae bacterium]